MVWLFVGQKDRFYTGEQKKINHREDFGECHTRWGHEVLGRWQRKVWWTDNNVDQNLTKGLAVRLSASTQWLAHTNTLDFSCLRRVVVILGTQAGNIPQMALHVFSSFKKLVAFPSGNMAKEMAPWLRAYCFYRIGFGGFQDLHVLAHN